jgi:DNA-binding transcriptional regulator YiaG
MPNFSSVLKAEITRLARKEIRNTVEPLRKANGGYRREIAELKRQLASLRRELKASRKPTREKNVDSKPARTSRFSANGLKALRARIGLSAADLGKLIGASGQSVYNWEAGKASPRATHRSALASLRGIGKREAVKRLEAMD